MSINSSLIIYANQLRKCRIVTNQTHKFLAGFLSSANKLCMALLEVQKSIFGNPQIHGFLTSKSYGKLLH